MRTITVKFDLELPDDGYEYEFVRYGLPKKGERFVYSNGSIIVADCDFVNDKYPILRRLEPALELETDIFVKNGELLDDMFYIQGSGEFKGQLVLSAEIVMMNATQARDLVRILTYYAEKGKLPERVKVKV